MPRRFFNVVVIAAIVISGWLLAPLRYGCCVLQRFQYVACIACAVSFLGFGAGAVVAQPQCDQRDSVIQVLRDKYGEEPVALGVTHNGGLVEVLTTDDGTTWSIIVTTPQGMSCLVAAGEGWKAMQQIVADPEASLGRPPLTLAHGEAEWIRQHPAASYCCGEDDCFPDRQRGITVSPAGPDAWHVAVTAEHPQARESIERTFHEGGPDVHFSRDGRFWVCVYNNSVRCLFRPSPGV